MPSGVYQRQPPHVRFWRFVNKNGPLHLVLQTRCWLWTGGQTGKGYGAFKSTRLVGAHVYSYELHYGPVPEGLQVNHRCENARCVNPGHLYAGSVGDNQNDALNSGRQVSGERHPWAKLTDAQALAVYQDPRSYRQIAKAFGISASTVCLVKQGKVFRRVTNILAGEQSS